MHAWPRPARPVSTGRAGAAGEAGSQALEFALVLPAVFLVLALVLQAGVVGAELVLAQTVAREAARAAAVEDDASARERAARVAGRPATVVLDPPDGSRMPGDLVTARVELESRAFAAVGVRVRLPGVAVMRVEDR